MSLFHTSEKKRPRSNSRMRGQNRETKHSPSEVIKMGRSFLCVECCTGEAASGLLLCPLLKHAMAVTQSKEQQTFFFLIKATIPGQSGPSQLSPVLVLHV